jgi:hypothetical protein
MITHIGIETCSLLAELSISVWTARKLDRGVSAEIVASKNAGSGNAVRANKHLLAGRSELEVVVQAAGAARVYFASVTMPWSDSGLRLLPSIKFMDVNQRLVELHDDYMKRVNAFVTVYPSLITGQAMALGDMFDRTEYPNPKDIASKFDFRFNFMPVPTAGDFRVDVGNEAHQYLQDQAQRMVQDRVEHAMNDAWTRLKEHCERVVDRLQVDVVEGKEKPRVFRDSLISNTFELVEILHGFNITGDQQLKLATERLGKAVQGKSAEMLREDLHTREAVQKKVQSILDSFTF